MKEGREQAAPLASENSENCNELFFGSGGLGSGVGVFLGEAFDAARSVQELLLAGEEGMAIGANFDAEHIALDGGACGKGVPAGTVYGHGVIVGMNAGLHESPFCRGRSAPPPARAGATVASLGREATAHYSVNQEFLKISRRKGGHQVLGISTATSLE